MLKLYHYNSETGEYTGESDAKLSPLDLKNGKIVYLIPQHATVEKPDAISALNMQKVNRWNGQKWETTITQKIVLKVAKELHLKTLLAEFKAEFPNNNIFITGNTRGKNERDLTFEGIDDTQENRAKLVQILNKHNARNSCSNIENLSPLYLASLKVLINELKKIAPSFPSFADFSQLVKDEYIQLTKDN